MPLLDQGNHGGVDPLELERWHILETRGPEPEDSMWSGVDVSPAGRRQAKPCVAVHVVLDSHGRLPGNLLNPKGPVLRDVSDLPDVELVVFEVESLEVTEVGQRPGVNWKLLVGLLEELTQLSPREDAPSASSNRKPA